MRSQRVPTAASTDKHDGNEEGAPAREVSGVIVLGAGRSGTSAIVRAFVAAGFFAGGDNDLHGPDRGNPLGHYESLAVLEVNKDLLETFGCSWWADAPAPEEQLPHRPEVVPRLQAIVDSLIASADGSPVIVKEPRINGLLPLWQPAIEGVLHPILAVRDPLEVALSHSRRDGTSTSHALAAWEAQTTLVLQWLDGRTATVAPYAQLTARPELAAELVRDAASHLDRQRARGLRPADAGSALRPDLHHESANDLPHDDYLTERQARLWRYLQALAPGDTRLEVPAELREASKAAQATMRSESERVRLLKAHAALVEELSKAAEQTATLERRLTNATALAQREAAAADRNARELARVRDSASWRLSAPLRRVKRMLHRSDA